MLLSDSKLGKIFPNSKSFFCSGKTFFGPEAVSEGPNLDLVKPVKPVLKFIGRNMKQCSKMIEALKWGSVSYYRVYQVPDEKGMKISPNVFNDRGYCRETVMPPGPGLAYVIA